MTSAAPAQRATPQMTPTPDPVTAPQAQAVVDAAQARPAKPRLRDQIADNPLLSLIGGAVVALLTILGTLVVALLVFTLTSISDRIDSLGERIDGVEVSLGERIDRLEAKVDAGFAAQSAQIRGARRLTAQIAEFDRS